MPPMSGSLRHAAEGAALLAVVAAPLALGTVHVPVILAVTALGCLAGVLLVAGLGDRRIHAGFLPLVLLALCAFVGLQLVPLPPAMLSLVAPRTHALWLQAGVQGWHPITLDPAGTALEL